METAICFAKAGHLPLVSRIKIYLRLPCSSFLGSILQSLIRKQVITKKGFLRSFQVESASL